MNAAKSTICDTLSEAMNGTAIPPGFKARFAQLLMTITAQVPQSKDTCVVQFRDESEGSDEPKAMATQCS